MTLTELRAFLQEREFIAIPRTWVMGKTLLVSHKKLWRQVNGINMFDHIVYVLKGPDEGWTYTDDFGGLEEAANMTELLEVLTRRLVGR